MRSNIMPIAFGFFVVILFGCSAPVESEKKRNSTPPMNSTDSKHISTDFNLVMLGDSITAGFGLPESEALPTKLETVLREHGANVKVINAGVSGNTSADALARFDWSVGDGADGVLIALGGNDLLQGVEPEQTDHNIRIMIKMAKTHDLIVLLVGMRAPGNYGEAYRERFDAIYPSIAREESVPLYPFLLEGVATNPILNQSDGIHPNVKGVAVIVDGLAPFIETALENSITSKKRH